MTTRGMAWGALALGLACPAGGLAMLIVVPGGGWLAYTFDLPHFHRLFREATQFGLIGVPEWAIALIGAVALLGILALRIAPTGDATTRRTSVAAAARRFAARGLRLDALAALCVLAAF